MCMCMCMNECVCCVCTCVCVCARARACVCRCVVSRVNTCVFLARVHACVRVCVFVCLPLCVCPVDISALHDDEHCRLRAFSQNTCQNHKRETEVGR